MNLGRLPILDVRTRPLPGRLRVGCDIPPPRRGGCEIPPPRLLSADAVRVRRRGAQVDGELIAQSKAIERFLAKRLGFAGADDVEAAKVDAVCEHVRDIKDAYQKAKAGGDETLAKWWATDMADWLQRLDKAVGHKYAVGSTTSLADIHIHMLIKEYFDNKDAAAAAAATAPNVTGILETFAAKDSVKAYLEKRPQTKF